MKAWTTVLAFGAAAAGGCQTTPRPAARVAVNPSVLDVSPAAAPAAAYQPPIDVRPASSLVVAPPPPPDPVIERPARAAAALAGSKYTVKKGDTLFHIAKERYGEGNAWRRIAAANPGVTPASLKVGQTLVMP